MSLQLEMKEVSEKSIISGSWIYSYSSTRYKFRMKSGSIDSYSSTRYRFRMKSGSIDSYSSTRYRFRMKE